VIELSVLILSGDARVLKDEYVTDFVSKNGLKRIRVDVTDAQRISDILSQNSLFSSFLVDVIDYSDWKKEDQKQLLEQIEEAPTSVIVRASSPIKGFETVDFSLPKPWEREKWLQYIEKRLEKHSLIFDASALEEFFNKVGPDDLLIEREIEKLSCIGEKVTTELVRKFVFNHSKMQIDELCFAVSTGDQRKSHMILSKILSYVEPLVVVNSLAKHFIDLYKILSFVDKRLAYSWVHIKDLSEKLDVPVVRAAKMLGFSFKGQPKAINHVDIYDCQKVELILDQLQLLDTQVKSSENKTIPIHLFVDFVCRLIGDRS